MVETNKLNYKVRIGTPMTLGAMKTNAGINFAVMVSEKEEQRCSVILYKKGTLDIVTEVVFTDEMKFGKVYAMCLQGISITEFDYNYRIGNHVITDPYAVMINGGNIFGENDSASKTSAVYQDKFNWENDIKPGIDFSDSIVYKLHVRGFTKSRYSKTRKKGTFAGIIEKIDYLKGLGITMIELMPAYEFNENDNMKNGKINYWGYTDADYFMPKVAYSQKKDAKSAIHEFKTMVKEMHKNGIEVCMEFAFGRDVTPNYMIDCFRHWVINYHIDGIHCNMGDDIRGAISSDPYLSDTKIISYGFESDDFSVHKHLGESNRVFMNTVRKFLKGDEGQVNDMAFRLKYNKEYAAPVNYVASNDTFTMMDMVSYAIKHNEENNEYNRDGMEDNNSWNCGFEGDTKRKSVVSLRMRQLKNAMCLLMLSQGTPMIYAGDEFGNSCRGNNNPYCQDNDISYLDWRLIEKNEEYHEFVKELIAFRKEHNILHMEVPMQLKDYRSLGMPDMSFHSEKTWSLEYDVLRREFGVMLYGKYCKLCGKKVEENIYMAFNMHWENKKLGLPTAGKNKEWKQVFCTDNTYNAVIEDGRIKVARTIEVPHRSVLVLVSQDIPESERIPEVKKILPVKKVKERNRRSKV